MEYINHVQPQSSIEIHQVPQSATNSNNEHHLSELTINQNELIDLGVATKGTALFDDMDFIQLKAPEMHCLKTTEYLDSTSTGPTGLHTGAG